MDLRVSGSASIRAQCSAARLSGEAIHPLGARTHKCIINISFWSTVRICRHYFEGLTGCVNVMTLLGNHDIAES
jgi:hypothetical protein